MSAHVDNGFGRTLERLFDPSVKLEARHALMARLRQEQADMSPRIDSAILQRDHMHTEAIRNLERLIVELRTTTEKLTGAPLNEGVFVAPCVLADGRRLARVVVSGARELLLEVLEPTMLDNLRAGDRVALAVAGNVVLGKSATAQDGHGECAMVERWLDTERVLLRLRDQFLVMRAAADLTPENLKSGESVRLDPLGGFAIERVAAPERGPYAGSESATSLSPDALAGYDDIRDATLRRITYAIAHPELAAAYGIAHRRPWILLGGAPGVGKTTLARIIAGDLQRLTGRQCRIHRLNGAELYSPYVGETEQRIRTLMREVRERDEWSIIFIDEAEAIARTRGGAGGVHSDRFLNSLLAELEGFDGRSPCILIAATNRSEMLDPAFRSRFSTEIEVPRPRMPAARAIFSYHLPESLSYHEGAQTRLKMIDSAVARLYLPNAPGALLVTLRLRDGSTRPVFARDLISGRLIEQTCVEAREAALARHVEGDASGLRMEDMDAAVNAARDRLRATLTPSNAHSYLNDLAPDVGVVGVDSAPPFRAGVSLLHEGAR